ncbi:MAG: ABC-F family ATP-binding cassette domain-containing protein [Deltaproteobacteria bacterium]|nr:ABC-F family ATP-binding cassette domain-containing protein [Deltaproteobacteria bacterium]MBI3295807.1 ABC-F family ATP-binding cassette domain-containing protein [Deltaproteobacteria bacterium]
MLLSASVVSKAFDARPLFQGLTFVVEERERIGLIGPNGAGKSTLLKILAGQLPPDSGTLSLQKGLRVGFLQQELKLPPDLTVEDYVMHAAMEAPGGDGPALAGELLSKLDLNALSHKTLDSLSGGWKKRAALARELVKEPDLLLLDEPTNHLDIESILWLETFLANARFASLIVTHDRLFLQRVTNRILEIDRRNPNGLLNVRGDYATYLEQKEVLLDTQKREERVLRNTLRRETEWLRRGPKARTTKQQARIQAAGELKEAVEELSARNETRSARINFQGVEKKPKRLIEARAITKRFGDTTLFKDFDIFIGPKDRIGLLGANGCGKSTLIQVLLGSVAPDSGQLLRAEQLQVAYFDQVRDSLDPTLTLWKALCPHGDHVNYRGRPVHVRGYADRFLFNKEQLEVNVGRLSGGERARVLIARLMLNEANILVLDEPTNDLDVDTLNVLQDCLTEFDGAVLLVTHDRYFLDQVASQIYAFPTEENQGHLTAFAGLDQWERWREAKKAKPTARQAETPTPIAPPKKRKLGFNETRELATMEGTLQSVEARLKDLESQSTEPDVVSDSKRLSQIFQEIAKTQLEIERLYARWAELEALR